MKRVVIFLSVIILGSISISFAPIKIFDFNFEKLLSVIFEFKGNPYQPSDGEKNNSERYNSTKRDTNINGDNNISGDNNVVLVQKTSQEKYEAIDFNYIRMFDIEKVPLFMRYIENTPTSCVDYHKKAQETIEKITKENPICFFTELWRKFSASSDDYKEFIKKTHIPTSDIGFLFLVLENKSEHTFYDIEITYYDSKIPDDKKVAQKSLEELPRVKETKIVPYLRPNRSFIWLLEVYKANDNKFPEYYLSNVAIPLTIEYLYNQKKQIQPIRKPYKEKAMTFPLPAHWISENGEYGWSGQ